MLKLEGTLHDWNTGSERVIATEPVQVVVPAFAVILPVPLAVEVAETVTVELDTLVETPENAPGTIVVTVGQVIALLNWSLHDAVN
jgi:hypothetical protein